MRNLFRNILILSVVLGLNATPIMASMTPEPAPAAQTNKQKEAEKAKAAKQKEKEKAAKAKEKEKAAKAKEKEKAAKQKEKEQAAKAKEKEQAAKAKEKEQAAKAQEKEQAAKAKEKEQAAKAKEKEEAAKAKEKEQAAKQKEQEARAKEKEKAAQERQEALEKKEAAQRAKEQKAVEAYKKQQEELANPKTPVISYFNIGIRVGYAAMMDKINGSYMGAGTINQSNALQQLKGGAGAGLDVTYNLEYGHFLFETGLDFRFLNSASTYGFTATRLDNTYGATYSYLFDNLRETRNMLEIGLPLMLGAQFNKFYFLVGAKVHYGLPLGYSQKGKYDIVVYDPAMLEPYGMGINELNGQTNQKIQFKQPDVSVAAEIGIDLDEWLQKTADPKAKKAKVKPGERQPFGRQHVHYRVGLFAEYGVLNTNATPAANPVEFATNAVEVNNTNTLLAMNGDTKLNNLFVGAKFTIQFEVPGKEEKQLAPPPSNVFYTVVDAETNKPLASATVSATNSEGKVIMREKQINAKGTSQKHALGSFTLEAKAEGYYPNTTNYLISEVGSREYVTIALRPRPTLRVHVTNKETGQPVPATIEIRRTGIENPVYTMVTDSITGTARQMLTEGPRYSLHIVQMGYDRVDIMIPNIGDSMNIALNPVKKGEVFIVKNLHFATNKTRILSRSEEALNDLYMYLARNPEVRIRIIGHTDNVGKDAANQKLSDGRANAVRDDLIERGIDASRIEAEGRGETQPIDTNDTEEGRQNNRRVEIEIL